jgi:hypothetical protein
LKVFRGNVFLRLESKNLAPWSRSNRHSLSPINVVIELWLNGKRKTSQNTRR